MRYFEAAVVRVHTGNKLFTYKTADDLSVGAVLRVPFGSKQAWAIVTAMADDKPKFITKQALSKPILHLPLRSVQLMHWMFDYYPEDYGLIAGLFLPNNLAVPQKSISIDYADGSNTLLPTATTEQTEVLKRINNLKSQRVLLHGDTGTGKTRVFIEIAKKILKTGKSVLILTPEIGLTPQLMDDLRQYLSVPIILTHSALAESKRRLVWYYTLKSTKPAVFVGPRSALFLPFNNLGLIVIDEAHDNSYKQLQPPKYQALHVAGKLATLHNGLLIQSTATPNIDEYEIAKAHHFAILKMTQTAAGSQTSQTHIIDIKDRQLFLKSPYLSDNLIAAAEKALSKKEQVMIFLNRRGSARLIQCGQCGWQDMCPNCNLPLVYHHDEHIVRCHTCSYKKAAPNRCPKCGALDVIFKVLGTKSLVEHMTKLFPKARIKRFDADSTSDELYYKQIKTIKSGAVDIIVGTQLITKGIDLPKLSVVGVINADSNLNLPDYRAEEITFQQLYQVTGRAARGHKKSQLFIQTRWPNHPVMLALKNRSWEEFYNYELPKRQDFSYPPKVFLAILKITKKSAVLAETKSNELFQQLNKQKSLKLLGPSPSFYEKTSKGYAWQIILKSTKRSHLLKVINQLPNDWTVNVDPSSLL
jgi:primosomal protein N' (replication factor Y)